MLITSKELRKRKRDQEIFRRRNALLRKPGAMKTAVDRIIMEEFGIASASTIYRIVRRVEEQKKGGIA